MGQKTCKPSVPARHGGPPGLSALPACTCVQLSALLPGHQAWEHLRRRPGSAGLSCLVQLRVSGGSAGGFHCLSLAFSCCSAGLLAAAENFCLGFCLHVWFQHCDSLGSRLVLLNVVSVGAWTAPDWPGPQKALDTGRQLCGWCPERGGGASLP